MARVWGSINIVSLEVNLIIPNTIFSYVSLTEFKIYISFDSEILLHRYLRSHMCARRHVRSKSLGIMQMSISKGV